MLHTRLSLASLRISSQIKLRVVRSNGPAAPIDRYFLSTWRLSRWESSQGCGHGSSSVGNPAATDSRHGVCSEAYQRLSAPLPVQWGDKISLSIASWLVNVQTLTSVALASGMWRFEGILQPSSRSNKSQARKRTDFISRCFLSCFDPKDVVSTLLRNMGNLPDCTASDLRI
jgi:hypothetical protein